MGARESWKPKESAARLVRECYELAGAIAEKVAMNPADFSTIRETAEGVSDPYDRCRALVAIGIITRDKAYFQAALDAVEEIEDARWGSVALQAITHVLVPG